MIELTRGKLRQVPLIAFIVVVINPLFYFPAYIFVRHTPNDIDFILHMPEEAFLWGVIPAICFTGHGLPKLIIIQNSAKGIAGIMNSLIGVYQSFCIQRDTVILDQGFNRFQDEVYFKRVTQRKR